jgi:hypothetical protein
MQGEHKKTIRLIHCPHTPIMIVGTLQVILFIPALGPYSQTFLYTPYDQYFEWGTLLINWRGLRLGLLR